MANPFPKILSFFFILLVEISRNRIFFSHAALLSLDTLCTGTNDVTVQFESIGPKSFGSLTPTQITHHQNNNNKDESYYPMGLNCTVRLLAPRGYKLHLGFSDISTRFPTPNCDNDRLEVVSHNSNNISRTQTFCNYHNCPSENCLDLEIDATNITVHFTSMVYNETHSSGQPSNSIQDYAKKGFIGMVTVFSKADNHGNCHTKEQFRCRNRHCIWKGLYCNKHNHCGDLSDEPHGCKPFAQQAIWGILVIVFGAVSFCIFLPLFCYFAIRGHRRRTKVTRSLYQPLPTSINDPRSTSNYTTTLMGPYSTAAPSHFYGTNGHFDDSSSSTEMLLPVPSTHSKMADEQKYANYQ